jgi:hypothetical protein
MLTCRLTAGEGSGWFMTATHISLCMRLLAARAFSMQSLIHARSWFHHSTCVGSLLSRRPHIAWNCPKCLTMSRSRNRIS